MKKKKIKNKPKCKEWEKRRREKLNEGFDLLAQLLPNYDPAKTLAKIEVLERSSEFVKELRLSNSRLVTHQVETDEKCRLIKQLQDECNRLILRVKQLTALLKAAKIAIPEGPYIKTLGKKRLKWSGVLSPQQNKASDEENSQGDETTSNVDKASTGKNADVSEIDGKLERRAAASTQQQTTVGTPLKEVNVSSCPSDSTASVNVGGSSPIKTPKKRPLSSPAKAKTIPKKKKKLEDPVRSQNQNVSSGTTTTTASIATTLNLPFSTGGTTSIPLVTSSPITAVYTEPPKSTSATILPMQTIILTSNQLAQNILSASVNTPLITQYSFSGATPVMQNVHNRIPFFQKIPIRSILKPVPKVKHTRRKRKKITVGDQSQEPVVVSQGGQVVEPKDKEVIAKDQTALKETTERPVPAEQEVIASASNNKSAGVPVESTASTESNQLMQIQLYAGEEDPQTATKESSDKVTDEKETNTGETTTASAEKNVEIISAEASIPQRSKELSVGEIILKDGPAHILEKSQTTDIQKQGTDKHVCASMSEPHVDHAIPTPNPETSSSLGDTVSGDKISECIARSIDLIDAPDGELMVLGDNWGDATNSPKSVSPTQMFLNMFPLLPKDNVIAVSEQNVMSSSGTSLSRNVPPVLQSGFSSQRSFFIDSMLPEDQSEPPQFHVHQQSGNHPKRSTPVYTPTSISPEKAIQQTSKSLSYTKDSNLSKITTLSPMKVPSTQTTTGNSESKKNPSPNKTPGTDISKHSQIQPSFSFQPSFYTDSMDLTSLPLTFPQLSDRGLFESSLNLNAETTPESQYRQSMEVPTFTPAASQQATVHCRPESHFMGVGRGNISSNTDSRLVQQDASTLSIFSFENPRNYGEHSHSHAQTWTKPRSPKGSKDPSRLFQPQVCDGVQSSSSNSNTGHHFTGTSLTYSQPRGNSFFVPQAFNSPSQPQASQQGIQKEVQQVRDDSAEKQQNPRKGRKAKESTSSNQRQRNNQRDTSKEPSSTKGRSAKQNTPSDTPQTFGGNQIKALQQPTGSTIVSDLFSSVSQNHFLGHNPQQYDHSMNIFSDFSLSTDPHYDHYNMDFNFSSTPSHTFQSHQQNPQNPPTQVIQSSSQSQLPQQQSHVQGQTQCSNNRNTANRPMPFYLQDVNCEDFNFEGSQHPQHHSQSQPQQTHQSSGPRMDNAIPYSHSNQYSSTSNTPQSQTHCRRSNPASSSNTNPVNQNQFYSHANLPSQIPQTQSSQQCHQQAPTFSHQAQAPLPRPSQLAPLGDRNGQHNLQNQHVQQQSNQSRNSNDALVAHYPSQQAQGKPQAQSDKSIISPSQTQSSHTNQQRQDFISTSRADPNNSQCNTPQRSINWMTEGQGPTHHRPQHQQQEPQLQGNAFGNNGNRGKSNTGTNPFSVSKLLVAPSNPVPQTSSKSRQTTSMNNYCAEALIRKNPVNNNSASLGNRQSWKAQHQDFFQATHPPPSSHFSNQHSNSNLISNQTSDQNAYCATEDYVPSPNYNLHSSANIQNSFNAFENLRTPSTSTYPQSQQQYMPLHLQPHHHSDGHGQSQSQNQPQPHQISSSISNFNLSSIFPEINDKRQQPQGQGAGSQGSSGNLPNTNRNSTGLGHGSNNSRPSSSVSNNCGYYNPPSHQGSQSQSGGRNK